MKTREGWRRSRPMKRSRKRRPYAPMLPGLAIVSGQRRSDPDYWKERTEAEAAREAALDAA